ncbi:thermonuclease family protein [Neorhizobium sp. T786]|uniref:thermonuclease family protein n=1 Tax=Pseudorhizobium xiangyangii TaxID=2883104 RepID=UPI001D0012F0|nr:thermonuclease family protein [Neorhizobium xiangyangii]MCB5201662.1 thermonuclease family protein [Neorhizobium xiangyangii]
MISALILCATLSVSDGDTLKCDGQLLRLLGSGVVNEVGIDTPELRTWKCQKERRLAKLAKNRLRELLDGEEPKIAAKGHDKFGRPLVNVYVGDREIGAQLLREGFAREWRKGRKVNWCD